LLQRHGAQLQYRHPDVPEQRACRRVRLQDRVVFRIGRPGCRGGPDDRLCGAQVMTLLRYLSFALAILIAAVAPAGAVERILPFIRDGGVERNGDLLVTETIRMEAEGQNIRRGILRDFPTTYTRNDGTRVEVGFTVQSVTRDGMPENWSTETLSNGVRV